MKASHLKTPLYLALFSALATMTAAAYAADGDATEDSKTTVDADVSLGSDEGHLNPIVGEDVKWTLDRDWYENAFGDGFNEDSEKRGVVNITGSDPIQLRGGDINISAPINGDDQKIVFRGQSFEMTGGTFANSSHIEFTNDPKPSNPPTEGGENGAEASLAADGDGIDFSIQNGTFTNSGSITFKGYDVTVGTDVTSDQIEGAEGKAEGSSVSFNGSKGSLTLDGSTLTIGTHDTAAPEYEHGKSPDEALAFGSVTLKKDSALTNKDVGYIEKAEETSEEKAGEGDETEKPQDETHTRVSFGSVIVEDTSSFVSAGAGETGESLTVKFGEGASASFEKTGLVSTWKEMTLDFVGEATSKNKLVIKSGATVNVGTLCIAGITESDSSFSNFIDIASTDSTKASTAGKLAVNGLVIDEFNAGASFVISEANLTDIELANGAGITAGHQLQVTKPNPDEKTDWTVEAQKSGTVSISGFSSAWEEVEAEETPSGKVEEGNSEDAPKYEWNYRSFSTIEAKGQTAVSFNGNQAGQPVTGKDDTNAYHAAIAVTKLNLMEDWINSTQTLEIDSDDLNEDGSLKDEALGKYQNQMNEPAGFAPNAPAVVSHAITNSDLSIDTLLFGKNEQTFDLDEAASEDSGENAGGSDQGEEGTDQKKKLPITSEWHQHTQAKLTISEGSNVDITHLNMQTGVLSSTGSNLFIENVDTLAGTFSFSDGYLGLNTKHTAADLVNKTNPDDEGAILSKPDGYSTYIEIGSPVVLSDGANVTLGGGSAVSGKAGSDAPALTILSGENNKTGIEFDASHFRASGLFIYSNGNGSESDGQKKGTIAINGPVDLHAKNLAWGVYNLFDGFDAELVDGDDVKLVDPTVTDAWKSQVEGSGQDIKVEKGQIIVGGSTVAGSGLEDVNAVNLLNTVFGGQRGGAADLNAVSSILNNAGSIQEMKDQLNSLVGVGVASGIAAMAVDFAGMTADQVEHHASTIPEGEGWWAMPLAGKLKSDDLAIGSTTGGYSIDATGIMGGYDVRAGQNWVVGIAGSYLTGDADSEGDILATSTDVRNYGLHLWGRKTEGNLTYTGTFSYSKTSGDATMAAFGAESSIDVLNYSAALRADLNLDMNGWLVIPHAGARISMYDFDDYQIKLGGSEVFSVTQDKVWIYEIPVGVKVASDFEYQRWTVRPYADLTLRARFGDTDADYTVTATTSDTINYDVSGKFVGDLRLGWMSTFKNLNLGMSYGFSAGDAGRQNHSLEATMRVLFE